MCLSLTGLSVCLFAEVFKVKRIHEGGDGRG